MLEKGKEVAECILGRKSFEELEIASEILSNRVNESWEAGDTWSRSSRWNLDLMKRYNQVALKLLSSSSHLLSNSLIDPAMHEFVEKHALNSIIENIRMADNSALVGSSGISKLEFKEIIFTSPLVLSNIHFDDVSFTRCTFKSDLLLSSVTSSKCIKFDQCTFSHGHQVILRFLCFPKPVNASEWRPSFTFKECSIADMWVFKSQVFLFFSDSIIRSSSLELSAESVVHYVNCRLSDAIVHDVTSGSGGFSLVPRGWFRDAGWTLD